ncbi:MAG: DUF1289 domain-containing protein [Gammaproteobacteria bacterium]|nr:MAG: DUF1289 domain-containing protein [Gammaproteobacteria bacterium]
MASPCVGICALDDDDICIGCQRSGDEITNWGVMDADERVAVLVKVAERENELKKPER